MRILLIDDHSLFREGIRLLLKRAYPDCDILEAHSCEEMISLTGARPTPELAILDLGLPGVSGIEGIRLLRESFPETGICVVSADESRATVAKSIQAGANGYMPKSAQSGELLNAIELIMAGGRHVPAWALDLITTDKTTEIRPHLTSRQMEILEQIADGKPNKIVADDLGLALGTVRVHVGAILSALSARNRTEAARIAREIGLLESGR